MKAYKKCLLGIAFYYYILQISKKAKMSMNKKVDLRQRENTTARYIDRYIAPKHSMQIFVKITIFHNCKFKT